MKNTFSSIKKHLMLKYTLDDENLHAEKSTNINVLLNSDIKYLYLPEIKLILEKK